jgi:hypothetical protein
VYSPASTTGPSVNGTSSRGIGARPSPHRPASIRTTTSRVPRLPWIVIASALCRSRSVEKRPGMPSTWSKWPWVNRIRSRRRKPAPPRSNWRCVPSPQSTRMRWLPASTRPGWLRSADGTLAEVPKKVSANIRRAWRLSLIHPTGRKRSHPRFLRRECAHQADFRCDLTVGFFAAVSFACFLPAIGISISF